MARKSLKDQLFDRDSDAYFAADRIMSVIRYANVGIWRDDLIDAHFDMVYFWAHRENERFDWCLQHGIMARDKAIAQWSGRWYRAQAVAAAGALEGAA
ncbi:MAG: hypothetical protein J0G28_14515 [Afipia sp.]|nr:hypothetical protein [Afipia sp.]OJW65512.1 MAG: hypothetical protein BGO65_12355 [Afipia sp. 64-13]